MDAGSYVVALISLGQEPLPEKSQENLVRPVRRACDFGQVFEGHIESPVGLRAFRLRQPRPVVRAHFRPDLVSVTRRAWNPPPPSARFSAWRAASRWNAFTRGSNSRRKFTTSSSAHSDGAFLATTVAMARIQSWSVSAASFAKVRTKERTSGSRTCPPSDAACPDTARRVVSALVSSNRSSNSESSLSARSCKSANTLAIDRA